MTRWPFLERAAKVIVLMINLDEARTWRDDSPHARLSAHLARYGIATETNTMTAVGISAAEPILSMPASSATPTRR